MFRVSFLCKIIRDSCASVYRGLRGGRGSVHHLAGPDRRRQRRGIPPAVHPRHLHPLHLHGEEGKEAAAQQPRQDVAAQRQELNHAAAHDRTPGTLRSLPLTAYIPVGR